MRLIAASFDHDDRPHKWLEFLPKPSDRVWTYKPGGVLVSAMLARPLELANGLSGVILGAVATVPERRRLGFASLLVEAGCQHYRKQGASFVIMWARDYLLDLYRPLGLEVAFREYYCDLSAPRGNATDTAGLTFGPFASFPHAGFEARRLAVETNNAEGTPYWPTRRKLRDGQWYGVMDAYPFAPEFSLLFAPSQEDPAFYAVIGHGHGSATIMEFSGNAEEFVRVRDWVAEAFPGTPPKFNITAPQHQALADAAGVAQREQNMCLLYRQLDTAERAVPLATWLDRF